MNLTRVLAGSAALALAGTVGLATSALAAPAAPHYSFGASQYSWDEAAAGEITLSAVVDQADLQNPDFLYPLLDTEKLIAVDDESGAEFDVVTEWGMEASLVEEIDTDDQRGLVLALEFEEIPQDFTGTLTYSIDAAPAQPAMALRMLDDDVEVELPEAEADAEESTPTPETEATPSTEPSAEGASFDADTVNVEPEVQTLTATTRIGDAPEPEVPAAERALTVDPSTITAADFVNQDQGVTITATGFDADEIVSLEVAAGPESVTGITLDEVADADGTAVFQIYGVNAEQASVYIGEYQVSVTGADDTSDEAPLTGSFTVTGAESGNAGGTPETGGSLPRTGAELGALSAGVALLIAGGAMVAFTARRSKA